MITAFMSLFGGGLGALIRFVPEIFKLFTAAKDRAHEYKMTELQFKIDAARATQELDKVYAQGEVATQLAELQAYTVALAGQAQKIDVPWVDALNATVRPVLTYWWMVLLTLYKLLMLTVAAIEFWQTRTNLGPALTVLAERVWTPQDAGILSMLLGFWFVDRAIRKR